MQDLLKQFSFFFIAGALSALMQFSVLIGLVELFFVTPLVASIYGYLVGAFSNYLLNHYITFKNRSPHRKTLLRFTLNSFFCFCLNFSIMYFLLMDYSYITSQVLTAIVILIWNFCIHRYWTFRA
jgi:putative flippase GtrA